MKSVTLIFLLTLSLYFGLFGCGGRIEEETAQTEDLNDDASDWLNVLNQSNVNLLPWEEPFDPAIWVGNTIQSQIKTVSEVIDIFQSFLKVPDLDFENMYDEIILEGTEQVSDDVLKISWSLPGQSKTHHSYAYYVPSTSPAAELATIIIPGSGGNEGYKIFEGTGYHGEIVATLQKYGDVYVLIKANNGILGVHNGRYRISEPFLYDYMESQGYSYSANYMADGLVIQKMLREKYQQVGYAGLSQGAKAAFFSSLQSNPDFAIVSSGIVMFNFTMDRELREIKWDGCMEYTHPDNVKALLQGLDTQFLFTWGLEEKYYAADVQLMAPVMKEWLPEAPFLTHTGGHEFPFKLIDLFMSSELSP